MNFTRHMAPLRRGALLFAASCLATSAACADTTTLRLSDLFPATYPFGELTTEFAKALESGTQNQLEVQVFPSGTLTKPDQCFEGVVQGLSDMCQAVLAYTPGRFPVMRSVDLPGYPSSGQLTTHVANDLYQAFKPDELAGVHVLYLHAHPPGVIMTTQKAVHTLDDLKGLRIRSTGVSADVLKRLGASPVSMPITQTYDPLKRGVLDGTDGTFNNYRYYRFGEVADHTTLSTDVGYVTTFAVVMNQKKWDALPQDVQEAVTRISADYADRAGKLWDRIENEGLQFAREHGHEFIRLAPDEAARWREAALVPVQQAYVAAMKEKGLDGEAILAKRAALIEQYRDQFPVLNPFE